MVIVADNKEAEDPKFLVMADDGSGGSVVIPSMLIGTTDGEHLKKSIHEQELKSEKHGNENDEDADEDHDDEDTEKESYRDYNGINHKGARGGRSKQVIVQAEISLATKTRGLIDVDLWYTGTYEFLRSGWDLEAFGQMQDIFTSKVNFQPRIITSRCLYCDQ